MPTLNVCSKVIVIAIAYGLLLPALSAQELDLPRKSPAASVSATIGYTAIQVDYHAPTVKEREIWGELVPYGELWRAGANEATTVCFSTDVKVEERDLAAGCYALFVIPQKKAPWTVVLNRDTSLWGTSGYNEQLDALRVTVDAKFARTANQERLQYDIVSQNIESGYLMLSWERLRLYLRIQTNTMERAVEAMQETLAATPDEQDWKVYREAADFLLWVALPRPALKYALRSAALKPNAEAHWIAARAYAALGDHAQALTEAEKVREYTSYYTERKRRIERQVKTWKAQD